MGYSSYIQIRADCVRITFIRQFSVDIQLIVYLDQLWMPRTSIKVFERVIGIMGGIKIHIFTEADFKSVISRAGAGEGSQFSLM